MISIVIPTLNEEKYIGRLLQSLNNQTFKDFEVIVVDGSSEDGTKEIARKYKAKFIPTNIRNVSHQRNLGAELAAYSRILFLDADGYLEPDFLEKSLKEIYKRKLQVTGCYLYPDSKNPFYRMAYLIFRQWVRFQNRTPTPAVNGSCFFTTKKIHKKVKGFNPQISYAEDYDYARKALKHCDVALLKKSKIYTSVRRFEKEGKFKTGLKYIYIALLMDVFGKKAPRVKYDSGKF